MKLSRQKSHGFLYTIVGLLIAILILAQVSAAQEPFQQALPGYTYDFPRDFYSHDDYRFEWWYYTGNLADANGREFGYQMTFFRVALDPQKTGSNPSRWKVGQIYFAHMTVSDLDDGEFYFFERINRSGLDIAGADSHRLNVWNEDWVLSQEGPAQVIVAMEKGTGIELSMVPQKPLVIHGQDGVSQKGAGAGNASHYFSFTRLNTTGTITVNGKQFAATGTSWMDHEYSSNQLNPGQIGWDWFSIKLDDKSELMLYQMRLREGGIDPFSSGSFVDKSGDLQHLLRDEFSIRAKRFWESPHSGNSYPAVWEIEVPSLGIHLDIEPDMEDQELYALRSINRSYWEGSVSVAGRSGAKSVKGKGYVELVGYGKGLEETMPDQK